MHRGAQGRMGRKLGEGFGVQGTWQVERISVYYCRRLPGVLCKFWCGST